ncbi:MAG: polysaccharide deacetylase family protein [Syntrophaceae bacterium]|nr:polysaccharide deacetylase family protein [Syntrophaceae bacterium]
MRTKVGALVQHVLSQAFSSENRSPSIAVLMYHEVLEDEHDVDAWTVVRASEFRKQMVYLKSNYDVINLDAARDLIKNGERSKGKYTVVTFDDGYAGNLSTVLPIMASLNLSFTVFCATEAAEQGALYWWDRVIHYALANRKKVTLTDMRLGTYDFSKGMRRESRWKEIQRLLTDLKRMGGERRRQIVHSIECQVDASKQHGHLRPMTPLQVRELASTSLVTVGAHSHTHDILTQLRPEEAEDSILRSKNKLEAWTGKSIKYFSYPNGDFSPPLMRAVKRAGFLAAVCTEERAWRHTDDIYAIPRIAIGRYDSLSRFKRKLAQTK